MDILIKLGGSLVKGKKVYRKLLSIINATDRLTIVPGGGELISQVLEANEIDYEFVSAGRRIKPRGGRSSGRYLALGVLQEQKALLEKRLQEAGIIADVDIPVKEIGKRICHFNGDDYVTALSINFDKTIIFKSKKSKPKSFPSDLNIEVIVV